MGATSTDYDTARVSGAEQDRVIRAERDRRALAYLERTGNADLAPVLGLIESPPPPRRPKERISPETRQQRRARRAGAGDVDE